MKKKWLFLGAFFCLSTMMTQNAFAEEEVLTPYETQEDFFSIDSIFKDTRKANFQFNKLDITNDNKLKALDLQVAIEDPSQYLDLSINYDKSQNLNQNVTAEFRSFPLVFSLSQSARGDELPFPTSLIIDRPPTKEDINEFFGIGKNNRTVQPKNVNLDIKEWVIDENGKLKSALISYEEEPQDLPNISKAKVVIALNKKRLLVQTGILGTDLIENLGEGEGLLVWVLQKLKYQNPKTVGEAATVISQAVEEYSKSLKPDFNELNKSIHSSEENSRSYR